MKSLSIRIWTLAIFIIPFARPGATFAEDFYSLGKNRLEVRLVDPSSLKPAKAASIDSQDIEAIGFENQKLVVYIKRGSWEKVRDFSTNNIDKDLGVFKDGSLLVTPTIPVPVDRTFTISDLSDTQRAKLLEGLEKRSPLDKDAVESAYWVWIKERATRRADDPYARLELAEHLANSGKKEDLSLAAKLYEGLLAGDDRFEHPFHVQRTEMLRSLGDLYFALGRPDDGITSYKKAIERKPDNEFYVHQELAKHYHELGKDGEAVKELKMSRKQAEADGSLPADIKKEIIDSIDKQLAEVNKR